MKYATKTTATNLREWHAADAFGRKYRATKSVLAVVAFLQRERVQISEFEGFSCEILRLRIIATHDLSEAVA